MANHNASSIHRCSSRGRGVAIKVARQQGSSSNDCNLVLLQHPVHMVYIGCRLRGLQLRWRGCNAAADYGSRRAVCGSSSHQAAVLQCSIGVLEFAVGCSTHACCLHVIHQMMW